ncbi:MAG: hypothetical protein ACON35_01915 [Candidatus Marinamargulisbacteria bacterium]
MKIRRTYTKNPNTQQQYTQQQCEKKIADCLSSLKVRASQQDVKNMVNCVCPNSNENPVKAKIEDCYRVYRANLFLSIQQHEGTNVNGDPWGTQSEK